MVTLGEDERSERHSLGSAYMKINYVNPDHGHTLIDLLTHLCSEDVMQLLQGGSSHWINERNLLPGKFGWGRGYGAFSVSQSGVAKVAKYIADQEPPHRKKSFGEKLKFLVERYELRWQAD